MTAGSPGRMKAMSKTPNYFRGKTIGAASGIGRATALIFAREGANVVCAEINEKGADETAAEVNVITLSVRSPTQLAL